MGEPILLPLQALKIKGEKGGGRGGPLLSGGPRAAAGEGPHALTDTGWQGRDPTWTHTRTYIWAESGRGRGINSFFQELGGYLQRG